MRVFFACCAAAAALGEIPTPPKSAAITQVNEVVPENTMDAGTLTADEKEEDEQEASDENDAGQLDDTADTDAAAAAESFASRGKLLRRNRIANCPNYRSGQAHWWTALDGWDPAKDTRKQSVAISKGLVNAVYSSGARALAHPVTQQKLFHPARLANLESASYIALPGSKMKCGLVDVKQAWTGWLVCPAGWFFNGLVRGPGTAEEPLGGGWDDVLQMRCCAPEPVVAEYGPCEVTELGKGDTKSFEDKGWVACKPGTAIAGFYRKDADPFLRSVVGLNCCELKECPKVDKVAEAEEIAAAKKPAAETVDAEKIKAEKIKAWQAKRAEAAKESEAAKDAKHDGIAAQVDALAALVRSNAEQERADIESLGKRLAQVEAHTHATAPTWAPSANAGAVSAVAAEVKVEQETVEELKARVVSDEQAMLANAAAVKEVLARDAEALNTRLGADEAAINGLAEQGSEKLGASGLIGERVDQLTVQEQKKAAEVDYQGGILSKMKQKLDRLQGSIGLLWDSVADKKDDVGMKKVDEQAQFHTDRLIVAMAGLHE